MIFRPSPAAEQTIQDLSKKHLLTQFPPQEYTGNAANSILQCVYKFHEALLSRFIAKIASRDAAEFLFFQYDEATKILHGKGLENDHTLTQWRSIEPTFRRAIKHLVELMCIRHPEEKAAIPRQNSLRLMEGSLICAEAMANLSELSESLYSVFPDEFKLNVAACDQPAIFEVSMHGSHKGYVNRLVDRIVRDRNARSGFVGAQQFDIDSEKHVLILDSFFRESHGVEYGQFIGILHRLIDEAKPAKNSFPTLFIHRQKTIEALRGSGLSDNILSLILDGFTVDPQKMEKEGRKMWNPKQENRALWRGFFLFPHPSGSHLAFSREMARENLIQLINRVCYKRLPIEWITPTVSVGLEKLSQASGKWFEKIGEKNLREVGIAGERVHRKIARNGQEITIPDEVGEIDFLGFDSISKLLIIIEAKMTFTGIEARFWRDDLEAFVRRKRSYAHQFRKKIAWVQQERARIQKALGLDHVAGVAAAMITLYPCIAQELITDFPCVSIAEFRLDFEEKKQWPYSQGLTRYN